MERGKGARREGMGFGVRGARKEGEIGVRKGREAGVKGI